MSAYRKKYIATKFFITLVEETTVEIKKEEITKLLDEGANVNERFTNDSDNTPLHVSVINAEIAIVNLLLRRGANINLKNNEGKTAVDIAKELKSDVGLAIVDLLEGFEAESQIDYDVEENETIDLSIVKHTNPQLVYNKRSGTSGIKGQLYESKLLTLVLLRASLKKEFNEFYLGTCLDGVGAFNDVCVRYIQDGTEGVIFLRAKHTNEVNKAKIKIKDLWRENGDFSLHRYFESYLTIIHKLRTANNTDELFKIKTNNVKCTFAVYTTAEIDMNDKILVEATQSLDETARDLICSGDYCKVYRYKCDENDIAMLTNTALIKHMTCIGKNLSRCIFTGDYGILFNDSCIRKFHVVLAQHVINVSDIKNGGYRMGSFRKEFFYNYDANLVELKLTLFKTFVAAVQIDKARLSQLIENVCTDPTVLPISELMKNILTYYNQENNILVITEDCFGDVTHKLLNIKVRYETFTQAFEVAVNETLGSLSFKLPPSFGNIDIVIDDEENSATILKYFAEKLIEILTSVYNPNTNQVENRSVAVGDVPFIDFNKVFASAVGNLLILDESKKFYTFNTNEQSLGKNAKIVREFLKSRIQYLDYLTVNIENPNFPKLTLEGDEEEKHKAMMFFNNLWFYTCQSKEEEMEELGKESIQDYCIANKHEPSEIASNARYDAIYFIIHNAVQKWWMTDENSHYLENNKTFIDRLLKEFSGKSLLNVISCMFINRMRKYDINFNKDAVDCLSSRVGSEATVLITEVRILTGIKLTQCFHNLNNYAFIDLDDMACLSKIDYHTIIHDLKSTKLKALIILYDDLTDAKNKIFLRLTDKSVTNNYILVTNEQSAEKLQLYITNKTFMTLRDARNDLNDLVYISQDKVLDKIFLFQGGLVKFSTIMTAESKTLIKARILQKIINNEIIDIGKVLTNPYYEEIKYYYVQRCLHRIVLPKVGPLKSYASTPSTDNGETIKINTLESLKDTVVIVGAPGMGKSTFLTYLSIVTKCQKPSIWIERINLLDQTKELYRLQENKIKINIIDALKFVCKSALSRNLVRFTIKPTAIINFDLEIINGQVMLKNCAEIDYLILFELEMFLYCYNKGNTILLFDGFDEICPHYKKEMTDILKCLVTRPPSNDGSNFKQRMWITSRSYNNITETLEKEFGVAYNLEMFTNDEQDLFMTKYFHVNLSVKDLDFEQFKNIDSFFEFMKEFVSYYPSKGRMKFYKLSTTFLQLLYFNAMNYFIREVNKPLTADKKAFTKKWALIFESRQKFFKFSKSYSNLYLLKQYKDNAKLFQAATFIFTPLHVYIVIEYFINQIKTCYSNQEDDMTRKWDFEMSTLSFYKYFIETKLKKIRFEQKNQMDLYNPDIIMTYEKELKEFMSIHKKLAFYATFREDLNDILSEADIEEIRNIIKGMEAGTEKTGIVDSILSGGIPKFVHLSFQEYLAVEYMADLLKKEQGDQMRLWRFILSKIRDGFLDFFDRKIEFDIELMNIITDEETKEMIFKELTHNIYSQHCSLHNPTILDRAIDLGLKQITKVLFKSMTDLVNINNLNEFITLVMKCNIFKSAADFGWDEVLCIILSSIRNVDAARLAAFNPGILKTTPYSQKSDVDIIRDCKCYIAEKVFNEK